MALLAAGCGRGDTESSPPPRAAGDAKADEKAAPAIDVEPCNLKSDEVIEFLPTFGTRSGDTWSLPVEAWVYEPEEDGVVRGAALKAVEEVVEIGESDARAERLVASMRPFMVDNEGSKHVVVQWGTGGAEVCETEGNGRCHGTITLDQEQAKQVAKQEGRRPPAVELTAVLPDDDQRVFRGEVQLLDDTGVSVISDIDDTIKITGCHDKKLLLENTLINDFRAAPGVPELYQRWAARGVAFHYVSNSPLPLLGALQRFIANNGLPAGSIKLKPFRWKDGTFIDLLAAPEDHKAEVLEGLVTQFSKRKFVLVGDTGERDPEIYAAVARKHPDRITKIYLRDPQGGTPGLDDRLGKAFDGLPDELWTVFIDGNEIEDNPA